MSDRGFDRTIFNRFEQPSSGDWNQVQSQLDRALRDYVDRLFASRNAMTNDRSVARSGFIGDGFKVRPSSPVSMSVALTAGLGFQVVAPNPGVDTAIDSIVGLSDLSEYKPLTLQLDQQIVLDGSDPVLERFDIIEVRADRRRENAQAVNLYDSAGKVYIPAAPPVPKTLAFDLGGRVGKVASPASSTTGIGYKTGTPAAVGVAGVPVVTPGYVKVATIRIPPAAVSIDEDMIADWRPLLFAGGMSRISMQLTFTSAPLGTLSFLNAPPGVRVALVSQSATAAGLDILVIAGDSHQQAIVAGGWVQLAIPDTSKALVLNDFALLPVNDVVIANDQTRAADAAKCNPTQKLAVGQRIIRITPAATQTAAGVTAAAVPGAGGTALQYFLDISLLG